MSARWYAFWSIVLAHIRMTLARPLIRITLIVQPLVVTTTAYFLYRSATPQDYLIYVVLGGGMAGVWSTMTFSSATDLNRERYYGTMSSLAASRTPLSFTFTAKICANALVSLIAPVVNLFYGLLILGVPFNVAQPAAAMLGLIAFLVGTSAFALCLSTFFLLSRSTSIFMNSLEYSFTLLGGLAFPITILPGWAQTLSQSLPLTWGMTALRTAFRDSALGPEFYTALGMCLGLGAMYYLFAVVLFQVVERRVRRDATLDLY